MSENFQETVEKIEVDQETVEKIEADRAGLQNMSNKRLANKLKRKSGLPYESRKGVIMDPKTPKPIDCTKCKFQCNTKITEEMRKDLCREFHRLDFIRQRDFILRLITEKDPLHRKGKIARRTSARSYFFHHKRERHHVCKCFFLATLCISNAVVNNAISGRNQYGFFVEEDKRGGKRKLPIQESSDCVEAVQRVSQEEKSDPSSMEKEDSNVVEIKKTDEAPKTSKSKSKIPKCPKPVDCTNCKFKCHEKISEEQRIQICTGFNKLDFQRQKDFICSMVIECAPKRRRVTGKKPLKLSSRSYFFLNKKTKHRVCKIFFQRTLCISEKVVSHAFDGRSDFGTFMKEDRRGKKVSANKIKVEAFDSVKDFMNSFATSSGAIEEQLKSYFGGVVSIKKMFNLYAEQCRSSGFNVVGEWAFRRFLKENYNLPSLGPNKNKKPQSAVKRDKNEPNLLQNNNENILDSYGMPIQRTVEVGTITFTISNVIQQAYQSLD